MSKTANSPALRRILNRLATLGTVTFDLHGENHIIAQIPRVEVKDGIGLASVYGSGRTSLQAAREYFDLLTTLPEGQYIVVNAYGKDRRAWRWNGDAFAPCEEN